MADVPRTEKRDLALAEGRFCYVQDLAKGNIKVYNGPIVISQTTQEMPVTFDAKTGKYNEVDKMLDAVQGCIEAEEQDYLILKNPTKEQQASHPPIGGVQTAVTLEHGRQIVIPGPTRFALWPGQHAELVKGHHLRSNQYLLIQVINEEEARRNWSKAIMKTATIVPAPSDGKTTAGEGTPPGEADAPKILGAEAPADLAVGKQYLIRGTEVSFYIPPTGISVLLEEETLEYVRDAETLERLEFAVLVDENGTKRYERGPQVVFPKPTEEFILHKDNRNARKSKAIELNPIQAIHVKVIADYEENGKKYNEGQELFITGKETAIYFPREEHAILTYDGKQKHFATAIPAGEGRYVMDRMKGDINLARGPAMLLPDPRDSVIIKRPLTDAQCNSWYPGNSEALEFNRMLREAAKLSPTTRAGVVSEGDFSRFANSGGAASNNLMLNDTVEEVSYSAASAPTATRKATRRMVAGMDKSSVNSDRNAGIADQFARATNYSQPRQIILDTRFEGVPRIAPWTGYAVQVVNSKGDRRVEQGPKNILLEYDEELEVLTLSTGKPKTTDKTMRIAYLRVLNNKVSDEISIDSKDHVRCVIKLAYNVNFEGDPNNWFKVENYVQWLCDHSRSMLKAAAKQYTVEQLYANHTQIVRDTLLGVKKAEEGERPGLPFKENGMRMTECEVRSCTIGDETVGRMLADAEHEVVAANIKISSLRRALDFVTEEERIKQKEEEAKFETAKLKANLERDRVVNDLATTLAKIDAEVQQTVERQQVEIEKQKATDISHTAGQVRAKAEQEQQQYFLKLVSDRKMAELVTETEAVVKRFTASQGGFSEALITLGNQDMMARLGEALAVQNFIGGKSFTDVIGQVFNGPLKPVLEKITGAATRTANGNIIATKPSQSAPA